MIVAQAAAANAPTRGCRRVKESCAGRYLKELLGRRSANGRGKRQAAEQVWLFAFRSALRFLGAERDAEWT